MATKKKMLQAAAGNAGDEALDITDVFSTYLYTGNESTQTITNGIDLDGEGGMVWIKRRNLAERHAVFDSERSLDSALATNEDSQPRIRSGWMSSFNADGFTLNTGDTELNNNGDSYASWTFRKAPKFFDVVTWTSDGSSTQRVNHNLGAVPGHIVMKRTDASGPWLFSPLYSDGDRGYRQSSSTFGFDSTSPIGTKVNLSSGFTATDFRPLYIDGYGTYSRISGATYVAYLFAHNDGDGEFGPDSDQDIIKCGSYIGNGSDQEIDIGFEPQWILTKPSTFTHDWYIWDTMRGFKTYSGTDTNNLFLHPNEANAESDFDGIALTSTGFSLHGASNAANNSGQTYIYMAIRRGPLAQPESATEVFDVDAETNLNTFVTTPWPTDLAIQKDRQQGNQWVVIDRMRGGSNILDTSSNSAENTNGTGSYFSGMDYMDGIDLNFFSSDASNNVVYNWKRASGYFDVVAYSGNSTAGRTVSHNLGVAPEMMWVKSRSKDENWVVYHEGLGSPPEENYIYLNGTWAKNLDGNTIRLWNHTSPTDSEFTLGIESRVNLTGHTYIAYLFATVPGVSKVGSYTGTGQTGGDINVDCGFTSGARFVMIKRTDASGSWWVADTARGIVSGNEPLLALNDTSAELTGYNMVEPYSSGFIVNGSGGGDNSWNDAGGNYIFYAIA